MFLTKLTGHLNKHKIKYALVGGYAVVLHGVVRGTIDIDLVTKLDVKSLSDLENCLKELGLVSRIPVTAKEIIQFRSEYISQRNLIAWSFANAKDPSQQVDVLINTDMSEIKSVQMKIDSVSVSVISIDDLIKMKTKSGREQDLSDVEALKIVRDEK